MCVSCFLEHLYFPSVPQALGLLWDLAHLPALSTTLVEQALDEHHSILSDSYSVKEQVKLQYVNKCVDDIKKVVCYSLSLLSLFFFLSFFLSYCLFFTLVFSFFTPSSFPFLSFFSRSFISLSVLSSLFLSDLSVWLFGKRYNFYCTRPCLIAVTWGLQGNPWISNRPNSIGGWPPTGLDRNRSNTTIGHQSSVLQTALSIEKGGYMCPKISMLFRFMQGAQPSVSLKDKGM